MRANLRKEKEYKSKKNDMIDAAKKLFFTKGFKETTMDNIAKEAEFTKRTLYSYFISKYDLFVAVMNQAILESSHTYDEALASKELGIEKIYAYADRIYKCYNENPFYLELLKYQWEVRANRNKISPEQTEESQAISTKNYLRLVEVFEAGKIDGSIRDDLNIDLAVNYCHNSLQMICSHVFYYESIQENYYYDNLELILRSFKT